MDNYVLCISCYTRNAMSAMIVAVPKDPDTPLPWYHQYNASFLLLPRV